MLMESIEIELRRGDDNHLVEHGRLAMLGSTL